MLFKQELKFFNKKFFTFGQNNFNSPFWFEELGYFYKNVNKFNYITKVSWETFRNI